MFICFDIGGTKTRVAASKDGKEFLSEPIIFKTQADFQKGVEEIGKAALTLAGGEKIIKAVGGVAGPLNKEHAELVNSPNLPGWINKPLKKVLEESLGAPVRVENDASLAGLGEALLGGGRDRNIVAYLTISTGIGGTRIVGGKIDENAFGFEPGFQILDNSPIQDRISGAALAKRFGKDASEIKDPVVWNELAKWLAYAVNNAIVFWSPEVVILGGAMMTDKDSPISLDIVKKELANIMKIFPKYSEIKLAELGDHSTLYGALSLL